MATSTIFQNIVLTEKEDIERFAKALEESEKCRQPVKETGSRYVTGKKEIKELVDGMLKANV